MRLPSELRRPEQTRPLTPDAGDERVENSSALTCPGGCRVPAVNNIPRFVEPEGCASASLARYVRPGGMPVIDHYSYNYGYPRHEHPRSAEEIARALEACGLVDIQAWYGGDGVEALARRPAADGSTRPETLAEGARA